MLKTLCRVTDPQIQPFQKKIAPNNQQRQHQLQQQQQQQPQ